MMKKERKNILYEFFSRSPGLTGLSIRYTTVIISLLIVLSLTATVQSVGAVICESQRQCETPVNRSINEPTPIQGSYPYVTLLFRFSDGPPISQLENISYFEGLINSTTFPSANHYLRENSYNRMNLDGSEVHGWYNLPGTHADYKCIDDLNDEDVSNDVCILDWHKVLNDGLPLADDDVTFPNFFGINVMFDLEIGDGMNTPANSFAGGIELSYDNDTKVYPVNFHGPWWYHNRTIITHEMFHNIGLKHSSGPYSSVIDSNWDAMSGAGTCDVIPNPPIPPVHEVYGCLGVHTIAWHKLILGWIDPARNFDTGSSGAGIIHFERLAQPSFAAGNYLMGKLRAYGSSNFFYTVEYRRYTGYDAEGAIPGEAVILHEVKVGNWDREAKVVDPDNNGDVNDDGAMWLPGETFLFQDGKVVAHVESMNTGYAVVSVSNQARNPVYADGVYAGTEFGTATQPWNTVEEAYSSVIPSGTVYMQPGTYNETLTLSKPSELRRQGLSGMVIIGQ